MHLEMDASPSYQREGADQVSKQSYRIAWIVTTVVITPTHPLFCLGLNFNSQTQTNIQTFTFSHICIRTHFQYDYVNIVRHVQPINY
jgi:hypothetical protein